MKKHRNNFPRITYSTLQVKIIFLKRIYREVNCNLGHLCQTIYFLRNKLSFEEIVLLNSMFCNISETPLSLFLIENIDILN